MRGLASTLVLCLAADVATAASLYESAPLGEPSRGGSSISLNSFLGAPFELKNRSRITAIGGDLGTSGSIFGALLPLSSIADLPERAPLELDALAVAWKVFSAPDGWPETVDFRTSLEVELDPGTYLLVFGSGLFGATGYGWMGTGNPSIIGTPFVRSSNLNIPDMPLGRWVGPIPNYSGTSPRFVVEGTPIAVPEPNGDALFGVAALVLLSSAFARGRRGPSALRELLS